MEAHKRTQQRAQVCSNLPGPTTQCNLIRTTDLAKEGCGYGQGPLDPPSRALQTASGREKLRACPATGDELRVIGDRARLNPPNLFSKQKSGGSRSCRIVVVERLARRPVERRAEPVGLGKSCSSSRPSLTQTWAGTRAWTSDLSPEGQSWRCSGYKRKS